MKTLSLAVAAALAFGFASSSAVAQSSAGANAPQYGVAVVDISKIFENHAKFKEIMMKMKTDMQNIDTQLKAKRDAILKLEEARNNLRPGTEDYKKLDDQLATEKAKFALEMDRLKKDLMERESTIYFNTYKQVSIVISQYAKQRKIGLVMKYSSAAPDPANSSDILKDINKQVVYADNIDITNDILTIINGQQVVNNPGAQPRQQ